MQKNLINELAANLQICSGFEKSCDKVFPGMRAEKSLEQAHFWVDVRLSSICEKGRRGVSSSTFGTLIVRFDGILPILWG